MKWITWELFEDKWNLPARSFPERCNFDKRLICIGKPERGEMTNEKELATAIREYLR